MEARLNNLESPDTPRAPIAIAGTLATLSSQADAHNSARPVVSYANAVQGTVPTAPAHTQETATVAGYGTNSPSPDQERNQITPDVLQEMYPEQEATPGDMQETGASQQITTPAVQELAPAHVAEQETVPEQETAHADVLESNAAQETTTTATQEPATAQSGTPDARQNYAADQGTATATIDVVGSMPRSTPHHQHSTPDDGNGRRHYSWRKKYTNSRGKP